MRACVRTSIEYICVDVCLSLSNRGYTIAPPALTLFLSPAHRRDLAARVKYAAHAVHELSEIAKGQGRQPKVIPAIPAIPASSH